MMCVFVLKHNIQYTNGHEKRLDGLIEMIVPRLWVRQSMENYRKPLWSRRNVEIIPKRLNVGNKLIINIYVLLWKPMNYFDPDFLGSAYNRVSSRTISHHFVNIPRVLKKNSSKIYICCTDISNTRKFEREKSLAIYAEPIGKYFQFKYVLELKHI